MIRVAIPFHLRNLAGVNGEVSLDFSGKQSVTMHEVLDALEQRHPNLRGTIRDHDTLKRRPFLRYFACGKDLSLEPGETPLPEKVVKGEEPFIVLGSIAGG
jgi:hypothetical protein